MPPPLRAAQEPNGKTRSTKPPQATNSCAASENASAELHTRRPLIPLFLFLFLQSRAAEQNAHADMVRCHIVCSRAAVGFGVSA